MMKMMMIIIVMITMMTSMSDQDDNNDENDEIEAADQVAIGNERQTKRKMLATDQETVWRASCSKLVGS